MFSAGLHPVCLDEYLSFGMFQCPTAEESTGSGGGGYSKPKYYSQIISYASPSGSYKVEVKPIPVRESSYSYRQEIDRFTEAALKLGFQLQAAQQELDLYQARNEQVKYELLVRESLRVDEFILDLRNQIIMLEKIKKRREEEEVILAFIASVN